MKQNFTESVEEERRHLPHLNDLGDVVVRADALRNVVPTSADGTRSSVNDDGVARHGHDVASSQKRFAFVVRRWLNRLHRSENMSSLLNDGVNTLFLPYMAIQSVLPLRWRC